MDKIWAPWRTQYVMGVKPEGEAAATPADPCVLCAKYKDAPENDRKNLVLFRGAHSFIMMNLYPYNSGHLMFVPYTHTGEYERLTTETTAEMTLFQQKMITVFRKLMNPDGFNIGMNLGRAAGAGITDHAHMHFVPRWNGDCNFMPVLADTKVISEHMDSTYEKLKKGIGDW
jgi:ATP adenylyltransferase